MLKINQKTKEILPVAILQYAKEFATIEGIIQLTIGAPDFSAPEHVKLATIEAIEKNMTGYGPGQGLPALREEICHFLVRKYKLVYQPENIIVTNGLTEAIGSLMLALLNPGDKVLIPSPFFSPYESCCQLANGIPIMVDTSQDGFKLSPERLEDALKTHPEAKILLINYPCNPTGISYSRQELQVLAEVIKKHDLLVISDEIYSELSYDNNHVPLAEYVPENVILMNGVSKMYAMTGWRVGFLACPEAYVEPVLKAHEFTNSVSCVFTQVGAIQAFKHGDEDIVRMKEQYQLRRNFVVKELSEMGFEVAEPQGAFYVFPKIPRQWQMDDEEFALRLAREAKVATVPGRCFGESGINCLRISYAASMENLRTAMTRMKEFVSQL